MSRWFLVLPASAGSVYRLATQTENRLKTTQSKELFVFLFVEFIELETAYNVVDNRRNRQQCD